jgi:hypothetical protein
MSGIYRALIAGCCLSLSGCLSTMWSPYGRVVSDWAGDNTSFEPPPVTDSNKISEPPADNSSAEVTQASEPPRVESPFDRARAKQQAVEPIPVQPPVAVTPVEHRGWSPAPTVPPAININPPSLVGEPKLIPTPPPVQSVPVLLPISHKPQGTPLPMPTGPVVQPGPTAQPGSVAQPGLNGQPAPLLPLGPGGMGGAGRMNPTVRGGILNLGPNDTGVERAIELAHQLSLLDGENKLLSMRVRQLETDLDAREKLIDSARTEVEASAKDVERARVEIEALRKDLAAARDRLRQAARDDLETLQTIITVLRRLTLTAAPMRPSIGE